MPNQISVMKKLLILFVAVAAFACSKDEPDPKTDFIRGTEWGFHAKNESRISLNFINDKQAILFISEFEPLPFLQDLYNETVLSYYYDYTVSNSNSFDMTIAALPWGDPKGPQFILPDNYKDMPPLTGHVDNNTLLLQKQGLHRCREPWSRWELLRILRVGAEASSSRCRYPRRSG